MSGEQAIFNLQIKKKSGLSLNPDIHHSKVFSSDHTECVHIKMDNIMVLSKVYGFKDETLTTSQ